MSEVAIRPAAADDLDAVVELIAGKDLADLGPDECEQPESIRVDLEASWRRLGSDLAANAWVAFAGEAVVGYTDVLADRPTRALLDPNGGVHPAHRRQGIGSRLLDLAEARARTFEPAPGALATVVPGGTADTMALLQARGYEETGRSWQLTAELEAAPAAPEWPPGLAVRTFKAGEDDRGVHRLVLDAFSDNESYEAEGNTFERWASFMLDDARDLELYFVVENAHGELVGCALCPWYPDIGWIQQVAVRRGERGKGLGMALLRHAFGELYRRGQRRVGLAVDSWNTTGAKRLYERAGMRVTLEHVKLEKPLG